MLIYKYKREEVAIGKMKGMNIHELNALKEAIKSEVEMKQIVLEVIEKLENNSNLTELESEILETFKSIKYPNK